MYDVICVLFKALSVFDQVIKKKKKKKTLELATVCDQIQVLFI